MAKRRILVVDDEIRIVRSWRRSLEAAGYEVVAACSLREALAIDLRGIDLILLDLVLADGHGARLLEERNRVWPRPAVAVVSGYVDSEWATRLYGECDIVVPKPVTEAVLLELVQKLTTTAVPARALEAFCRQHALSPRETQLLTLALAGFDNAELATRLGCRPGTIKTYWRRLLAKTHCASQRHVIAAVAQFRLP
ncbi:MAG: response regulator transcription factor [Deltaproteobacteria bacterium]|nr:response regulator transcription factor [Deltaproteobacteria bacterium]